MKESQIGKYMIIENIERESDEGMKNVYIGYWVEG